MTDSPRESWQQSLGIVTLNIERSITSYVTLQICAMSKKRINTVNSPVFKGAFPHTSTAKLEVQHRLQTD
ncbi:hypothetical protein TDB9533_02590 [Thalassocella blandensis]|nr:hypothetical protein TDB9533_02590 [Thalassocella blandensis]